LNRPSSAFYFARMALSTRQIKRVVITVAGGTVLLIGVALLILPGPAFVVIPLGLAILASEYAWARIWLRKVRRLAERAVPGSQRKVTTPTRATSRD
jgi:uncharacterized protein (TIGR02611 family)